MGKEQAASSQSQISGAIDIHSVVSPKGLCDYPPFKGMYSEATLCRQRAKGKGPPFIYINGRVFYKISDVVKYHDEHTFTSSAEIETNGGRRFEHLPTARAKAALKRKNDAQKTK